MKVLPRRLAHGEEATLTEHLTELRQRLVLCLLAVIATAVVAFVFHKDIIEWLMEPLPDDRRLVTLGVTEPFFTAFKVSVLAGMAAALPIILYQLWSFFAPALHETTQRVVAGYAAFAASLFGGGIVFGYYVLLPKAISFLTKFDDELYDEQIRASYYLSFVTAALLGMALVFELPIFVLALVRLRILTADRLRRNRRLGIVLVVIVAILLPTVDPVSLLFEAVPLLLLFELSIWLSVYMERRWARRLPEEFE